MTNRDWWLIGLGMNAMGAVVGALTHSMFLVIWNMAWIGIGLYMVNR